MSALEAILAAVPAEYTEPLGAKNSAKKAWEAIAAMRVSSDHAGDQGANKWSEFSFVISSAELRPMLVLVQCARALFFLPSSISSHSVWSATTVYGRHR